MTPHQQKALVALRDRGVPLHYDTRNRLIRDGHLSADGKTILTLRPEDLDTSTQGDKAVAMVAQGKTVIEIAATLNISRNKVYSARKRNEITGTPTRAFNLRGALAKAQLNVGTFNDFLAASPDIEAVFALAARERITMLEAAGRLLRRDEKPHPVFRRSVCL